MKYILPLMITVIILTSQARHKNTYDAFLNGASEGLMLLKTIFPPLLGVMTAASMLRVSGAMELLASFATPLTQQLGIPSEVLPIALLRPVSGGGSLGLLSDILKTEGADSFAGRIASVIMGATETTFYCISVYFAKTRVKSTAKILLIALLCDAISVIVAVYAVKIFCT